jgi:hypothetical protein
MSTLEEDLSQLNFEYLMLARDAVRSNALEAAWRFGFNQKQLSIMETLTLEKIRELASNSRAIVRLLPLKTPQHMAPSLHSALLLPTQNNWEGV